MHKKYGYVIDFFLHISQVEISLICQYIIWIYVCMHTHLTHALLITANKNFFCKGKEMVAPWIAPSDSCSGGIWVSCLVIFPKPYNQYGLFLMLGLNKNSKLPHLLIKICFCFSECFKLSMLFRWGSLEDKGEIQ